MVKKSSLLLISIPYSLHCPTNFHHVQHFTSTHGVHFFVLRLHGSSLAGGTFFGLKVIFLKCRTHGFPFPSGLPVVVRDVFATDFAATRNEGVGKQAFPFLGLGRVYSNAMSLRPPLNSPVYNLVPRRFVGITDRKVTSFPEE